MLVCDSFMQGLKCQGKGFKWPEASQEMTGEQMRSLGGICLLVLANNIFLILFFALFYFYLGQHGGTTTADVFDDIFFLTLVDALSEKWKMISTMNILHIVHFSDRAKNVHICRNQVQAE